MDTSNISAGTLAELPAPSRTVQFRGENTYALLPERFYSREQPTPVAAPRLIRLNQELARDLGFDPEVLSSREGVEVLAGNHIAAGSAPIAIAYAGHQFGHFVPQLGDGRANLLGEMPGKDGMRYDIQLKGSGPTMYSRRGDGRAALGPVLREYILSEAMTALRVPSTRALAAVLTGETVWRETPQPGAIFARVAASHLRVGTFQYFAAQGDVEAVRILADYAIARHYSEAAYSRKPFTAFLDGVIARQAHLVAQWMLLGFIHGVMNTDNMAISGETIDYGPCAFMEEYDPATVFSSIDMQGRYAYANQPRAAYWDLMRLAESLLPILEEEHGSAAAALVAANEALAAFVPRYEAAREAGLGRKLGLSLRKEGDTELAERLLQIMTDGRADFTLTFRRLSNAASNKGGIGEVRALFSEPAAYDAWAAEWHQRLEQEPISPETRATSMNTVNPAFIPRNHLVQVVIDAAIARQDFLPFEELLSVVTRPFDDQPAADRYLQPARPAERIRHTFCGT